MTLFCSKTQLETDTKKKKNRKSLLEYEYHYFFLPKFVSLYIVYNVNKSIMLISINLKKL